MKSVHPVHVTNQECLGVDKCQELSLTEIQKKIVLHVSSVCEVETQRSMAKVLGISYTSMNENMRHLVNSGIIKPVSVGKGRLVKYLVNKDVVPSICKSDFQSQKLQCDIDKTTLSAIKLKDFQIKKAESMVLDKLLVGTNIDAKILIETPKRIVHGRLYYEIDGKRYTPKQAVRYLSGEIIEKGVSVRCFSAKPNNLIYWRNAITGVMQFNVDFAKIDEIYPEEMEFVKLYRQITKRTQLSRIGNMAVIGLIREFTPQVVISKVLYIISRIKSKIRRVFSYLHSCLASIDEYGEEFIDTCNTDSGTIVHPKLMEFYLLIKNRSVKNVFELFSVATKKILGYAIKSVDVLCGYFCDSRIEICSLANTREGY